MITSRLFEAFLACPTKCFLRSIGQSATDNTFTSWKEARDESYRREGFETRWRVTNPHFRFEADDFRDALRLVDKARFGI